MAFFWGGEYGKLILILRKEICFIMMSRNNINELIRHNSPAKQRFTIKKLTIGTASILLGLSFMGLEAHADSTVNGTPADVATPVTQNQGNDAAHTTPQAGINYNQEYQENATAVTVPKGSDQSSTATTSVAANGVTTQVTISSTNKNTGQTSSVKSTSNNNKVIIDAHTASNGIVTFTISNPTNSSQSVGISTQFPAWFGTGALIKVDPDRTGVNGDGSIAFAGDYAEKGLNLQNYDLATSPTSSSGYSNTGQAAAQDPSLIGGFSIVGNLDAGQTATIIIPIKLNSNGTEDGMVSSPIGVYYGIGSQVRVANVVTDLDLQRGKHYFLADAGKSTTTEFHSIDQSVLDALAKDGLSPLYENGDVKFNNVNWYSIDNAAQGNEEPIYSGAYLDMSTAQNRLKSVLNQFGYDIVGLTSTGFGSGSSYVMKPGYKYYDAQGNEIQLGTGNLSNFMLSVRQVIAIKDRQATVLDVNDPNYQAKLDNMFTDPSASSDPLNVDSSNVDITKPGVYPVKVSSGDDGTVSRTFNVVVVKYANAPETTKAGEKNHRNITADQLISPQSLTDLRDNGYNVSYATEPSYTTPGTVPVSLVITDADGNTHTVSKSIIVDQTINVKFVDGNGTTITTIPVYGRVGTTLGDQQTSLENAAHSNSNLSNYTYDLSSVFPTEFLGQEADQFVTVSVTKRPDVVNTSNNSESHNVDFPAGSGHSNIRQHALTNKSNQVLPQTGNDQNSLAVLGLGLASLISMFGLGKVNGKH